MNKEETIKFLEKLLQTVKEDKLFIETLDFENLYRTISLDGFTILYTPTGTARITLIARIITYE